MSTYEKYRYGNPEQPEHGHVTHTDGKPSAYFTPTGQEPFGVPVEYDHEHDVFGDERNNTIRYKTASDRFSWEAYDEYPGLTDPQMSWQAVSLLMIAEIVSNGMLSLPQALAVVGMVPGVILIVFLGIFATFTAWVLIQFKLRHPSVHNMGDAGSIIFGPIGREVLSAGTVIMAVFFTGSQLLAGQIALAALSDSKLCLMLYTGIFAIATLLLSFPRQLESLSWMCIPSCACILIAGIVGMAAAGAYPAADRHVSATVPTNFYNAFVAVTNPVFAYAGHFMFFILISEMKRPQDAMKAAYTLQGFATAYYTVFAVVMYVYLGPGVASPAFSSLPTKWKKATYGIALPNFLIAGSLYAHTSAKLFFIRLFRNSVHLHEHTVVGWGTWTLLIVVLNAAAFVLAVGVPIFPYLVGISAALFASWYTYGIAGAFWLHDSFHDRGGFRAWVRQPIMATLNALTFAAGAFICVAGTYVTIKLIVDAYHSVDFRRGGPLAIHHIDAWCETRRVTSLARLRSCRYHTMRSTSLLGYSTLFAGVERRFSQTEASLEQLSSGLVLPPPPPPPPSVQQVASRRRRRADVVQPPALTTSLAGLSYQGFGVGSGSGYGSAPNSTTSLSSPFSQNNPAALARLSGISARDTSPMAMRQSSGQTVPYNPLEWTSARGSSPQLGAAGQQGRASPQAYSDELMTVPPPPYSLETLDPASRTNTASTQDITSPGSNFSRRGTPSSAATTTSPGGPVLTRSSRSRPVSMIQTNDLTNPYRQSGYFPLPPPPKSNRGLRPSSQILIDEPRITTYVPTLTLRNRDTPESIQSMSIGGAPAHVAGPLPQMAEARLHESVIRPPSSRRAVSAGELGSSSCSSASTSRTGSRSPSRLSSWEPGMPLPGPPPGPPPRAPRSQSASGTTEMSTRRSTDSARRPLTRQAPALGTSLGPVPPTPADWVDEQVGASPKRNGTALYIDTTNLSSKGKSVNSVIAVSSPFDMLARPHTGSSSGLYRSAARRESAGGIRERRSASRNARMDTPDEMSALSISSNPWAEAMIAKPASLENIRSQDGTVDETSATTSSGDGATPKDALISAGQQTQSSSQSTPRGGVNPLRMSLDHLTQTPPFSPGGEPCSPTMHSLRSPGIPPKALPTPPLQPSKIHATTKPVQASGSRDRSISHLLQMQNDAMIRPAPLSPKRISTDATSQPRSDQDIFVQESIKRHQIFLEKERVAVSDEDRLRVFADYILAESRLRRRRYSHAWTSGNFDVRPVRERLFEQTPHMPRRSSGLQESTIASPVDPGSPIGASDGRSEAPWWSNYQPCLSPIASMSNNDEMSSRGRTPSRWWESCSGSDGAARHIERSKRETKYMGLPRELREAMQLGASQDGSVRGDLSGQQATTEYPAEKANPEKFGVYEGEQFSPVNTQSTLPASQQATPPKLNVSRLITLPPPYPRHYPAVNNSHPDLLSYRTIVRSVSDFEEVTARKKRYRVNMEALQKDTEQKILDNRFTFRSNIRAQIEDGSISFAEAAEAEEALKVEEHELEKQRVQAEFDSFQDVVLNPLHEILNERISQANSCLHELGTQITTDGQSLNPNQTQEEGDEQPELLERLTQLKWLFEARENNHREVFALLSERNEKFKAIVMLPYRQANNKIKMRDTEAFFAADNHDRRVAFESEALTRHQTLLEIIDANVGRGVELQLSAFWDIAPDLLEVLQSIPDDLRAFEGIEIPDAELTENPSYHRFPLQYLYSLLSHAERSAYQFIESQTNLLCLLHEAKTGVMAAEFKLREMQNNSNSEGPASDVKEEIARAKNEQEKALTLELKDHVSTIEEQWVEALGSHLESTKQRIKSCLMEDGGWDDMEQAEE